jgi:hypothetical protein
VQDGEIKYELTARPVEAKPEAAKSGDAKKK